LRELPLPTPVELQGKHKSLFYDPRDEDAAGRILATADPTIISQMARVLGRTNIDHM